MKRTSTWGALICLLMLLGAGMARAEDQSENGYWWEAQSRMFKLTFTLGYVKAMDRASGAVPWLCAAIAVSLPGKSPSNDVMINDCQQTRRSFDYSDLMMGQLADGVDELYKDFRNKAIDITLAMQYVHDELNGKAPEELEKELKGFREADRTLKELKELASSVRK
jgi:hypothetical protein